MKVGTFKFFIGLLLLLSSLANAKTVRLITIGPGDAFWSAFGQTAIAIDNDVYGFGYFSFNHEIFTEFISNQMQYELGLSELNHELKLAQQQNRDFSVIELNLTFAEINQIETYLNWHIQPENQAYHYDYFLNNCSTKVRDILNDVWLGQLNGSSSNQSQYNYISQTFPAKHQGLMNLGLVIAYGWPAYEKRSVWELMAFPVYFETHLTKLLSDNVKSRTVYYEAKPTNALVSFFLTHWAFILYVICWLVLLTQSKLKRTATKLWFYWHALIGLVLLCFWFLTPHQVVSNNFNVLLFSPLGAFTFRWKYIGLLTATGYLLWFLIALYLDAWYLLPLLLPGLLAIQNLVQISRLEKPRLTFGGVG